ncbi:cytochrome c [Psychrosphaera saromensis]|uniref:Cytochrome C n=1 Tax=Psychrosphaera saromensis TaxID=716813 RepID=A0A2S7USN3_9GAMM|nr:cytochrome c [Psychrosphaera saromensis]PQJ52758.1 cytochrome C [Psychrosphaera saromensis]GHB70994.1 cytochrome c [Psychrosphaera saromensis]GLQ13247.1 cytochrome c [Psychrosphaera saromensis]
MKNVLLITSALIASFAFNANAADIAAGKAASAVCGACHGAAGISVIPMYPNLAGQKEAYLVKQLKAFKSGTRTDPVMSAMAMPLSDADIANVSAYFASLK